MEKDINLKLDKNKISSGETIKGSLKINYDGRYDSIVINSQIERSNDTFIYTSLNGKKINHPYARLSIFKTDIGGRKDIDFEATTAHSPQEKSNAKFRVTIIQEHKEVASDIVHIEIQRSSMSH